MGSVLLLAVVAAAPQTAQPRPSGLRVVVIAGEDAVNIIQQKTAVAPIVEVRDRNDQPVAGAVVNFAVRSGRATFGGARTLSVTTDVLGRAVAGGLTPTGTGALEITASAAFQGQTAAVTIAQTNVMTAAQAAAVGGAQGGSGAGSATGAAAGGSSGGGMSGTTIGIIAGGVGGAALAATQLAKDETGGGGTSTAPSSPSGGGPPRDTVYAIVFTPSLAPIAQCPQYTGPQGPGVGPFGMNITVKSNGTFSDLVSLVNPVATLSGTATATSIVGTFACNGGGGPSGGVNATGTAPEFQGSWNWGGQSGTAVIRLAPNQ